MESAVATTHKRANRLESTKAVGLATEMYYQKMWDDAEQGILTAWGEGLPYWPLVRAAGINYVFIESMAARMGARKVISLSRQAAADVGFLDDVCSYARNTIGAARILKGDFNIDPGIDLRKIAAPLPNLYVNTDCCGTATMWTDYLTRYLDIPAYIIQTRRSYGEEEIEIEVPHVVEQEKEMIAFLENMTGRPFDWEKLHEIMVELRKSSEARKKIRELLKNKPAPMTLFDTLASIAVSTVLFGMSGSAKLLEDILQECEDRLANGIAAIPGERYRLYWIGGMYWPKLGYLAEKFAALDTCVISGTYDTGFFAHPEDIDPEHPLESLARASMHIGPTLDHDSATRRQHFGLCRDWDIDGIVAYESRTCRLTSGPQKDGIDFLVKRLGLPVAWLGGDFVEESFFSEAQWDNRLQALLEVIDARRRRD